MTRVTPGSVSASSGFIDRLRDARFSGGLRCPHCGHDRVQRWGSFSGRQRYRCTGCRRTFSDFTGTPAAYLKKPHLLPAYADCFARALSVRRTAARVGLDPSTAFRWRHRLCDWLRTHDRETVSGWVEMAWIWFRESRKGQRGLHRQPRKRGLPYRLWFEGPFVQVLVACDRRGGVVTVAVRELASARVMPTADVMEGALIGRIQGPSELTAMQGPLGPVGTYARRIGAAFHDAHPRAKRPPPWHGVVARLDGPISEMAHVRTATAYVRELRQWLAPFRGIATKYLSNYLVWHRRVDAARRYQVARDVLRWPLSAGAA